MRALIVIIALMQTAAIPPLSTRYDRIYNNAEGKTYPSWVVDKPKKLKKKCTVRKKHQPNRCLNKKQHKATPSIDLRK
jgi:hypothetical protein